MEFDKSPIYVFCIYPLVIHFEAFFSTRNFDIFAVFGYGIVY